MDPTASPPSFAAVGKRALRDAGLAGKTVQVTLKDRALLLAGADSGTLKIEVARTGRMRFGYFQGKHRRVFTVSIWPLGEAKPLVLEPVADDALGYGAAMRGFSQALVAARGIASIERGISAATAVVMLLFMMLPTIWLGGIAYVYVDNVLLKAGMYVFAALFAAIGVWLYFKRQRPQPVASLEEIEKQLPDPVSGV